MSRAGEYVSNLTGEMMYKSFCPSSLPPFPPLELDDETQQILINAYGMLVLLDGLTERIPDVNLFVFMYLRKEALMSSQIEGTQCTLDDVLSAESGHVNKDVEEVISYIKAVNFAVERMKKLPISLRLLKETHNYLMENARGEEKNPGEFRTSQNWIGSGGSTIKNAMYIPPNPEDMSKAMSDLELFLNKKDKINPLVKIALAHYHFETIHPFLDGNGRIGRMLITLYLMNCGLIKKPILYMSYFLKLNRSEYYERMNLVRQTGDYEQWVKFFLKGIRDSSIDAISTIDKIRECHDISTWKITNNLNGPHVDNYHRILSYLEHNPIIDITKTSKDLGISYNSMSKYFENLVANGILKQTSKNGKTKIFSYENYLEILRKDCESI